jgi:hypothetical protein
LLLAACTPEPVVSLPGGPAWNELDTGKRCASARVACGTGNCAARIRNACDTAVTCQLTVQCVCRALTGEQGEALGRTEDTILAGAAGGLLARVVCDEGDVLATLAKNVRCR